MAQNETLYGAAGARQGKVIFQNGKLRLQAGTAPAWTDYITVDSNGLIVLPTATASASGLKFGSGAIAYSSGNNFNVENNGVVWLGYNAGIITIKDGDTNKNLAVLGAASLALGLAAANGQAANIKHVTGTKTCSSGTGTETVTGAIPAGSIVLGVSCYVTTILAGAGLTTWSVGDGTDLDRWGAAQALAAGTDTDLTDITITTVPIYAAATDLTFTAAAGVFSSGVIRYTIHYIDITKATS